MVEFKPVDLILGSVREYKTKYKGEWIQLTRHKETRMMELLQSQIPVPVSILPREESQLYTLPPWRHLPPHLSLICKPIKTLLKKKREDGCVTLTAWSSEFPTSWGYIDIYLQKQNKNKQPKIKQTKTHKTKINTKNKFLPPKCTA